MKIILIAVVLLIMALGNSRSFAGDLVQVGLQKQLLVDDYVIAQKQNITRELGKPTKIGVVMGPSVPTDFDPVKQFSDGLPKTKGYDEFGRRLSVVWNEKRQLFQMLYRASAEDLTAYAESSDGIQWIKPFISEDGKSNLITYRGKNRGTFYEASFMIDPNVPWVTRKSTKRPSIPVIHNAPLLTQGMESIGKVIMVANRLPEGPQILITKSYGTLWQNVICCLPELILGLKVA